MSRGVSRGGVCLGIIRGQGGYVQGGIQGYPEYMGHGILQDTVDMRAVRTLLECFLVLFICCFVLLTVEDLDNPGNVYAPYSSTCSPLSYITLLAQLFAKHNQCCGHRYEILRYLDEK